MSFSLLVKRQTLYGSNPFFISGGFAQATWWQGIIYALVLTHITITSVTIFLYRSQAHRVLCLHPFVMHCFLFWLRLTTDIVTKEWIAIYRKHRTKCERERHPHSPMMFGIWKVLLRGGLGHPDSMNSILDCWRGHRYR